VKIEEASAVATRFTWLAGVVFGTVMLHPAVDPVVQEIPPSPVIVPFPVPEVATVRT
jgi:hypothetical protein